MLCLIATWTCVVVSVILVVCSLCVFLSRCLFLCVLCLTVLVNCLLTVLVNCLLTAFAICVGEVNVFSLNFIVLFLGSVFLLANPCMVFKRVCVLCL